MRLRSMPEGFASRARTPSAVGRAVERRGLAIFAAATGAALLLAGAMLFAIWARTRVTAAGYQLDKSVREHQQLLREREGLQLQLARLKGAGRLHALAQKLGMAPPPSARTIVLVEDLKLDHPRILGAAKLSTLDFRLSTPGP